MQKLNQPKKKGQNREKFPMHRGEMRAKARANYDDVDLYESEFVSFDHDGLLYSDDG
jgi:hypothetical protein